MSKSLSLSHPRATTLSTPSFIEKKSEFCISSRSTPSLFKTPTFLIYSVSGAVGFTAIRILIKKEKRITLARFQGHAFEYPTIAFVFLLACLGMAGFPITPTMIGEDLVFSSIREDQYFLALFLAISLIVDGLALVRIYARLFLGPHVKTYHSIAHKSS